MGSLYKGRGGPQKQHKERIYNLCGFAGFGVTRQEEEEEEEERRRRNGRRYAVIFCSSATLALE
jgi:hypothetical protein